MLCFMTDFVVCTATNLEADRILQLTRSDRRRFEVLVTGIGPVNAAMALTRHIARNTTTSVISLGIGGAYPVTGLQIGDVVCAESECYGDLGADSPDGFLDMKDLGFPVFEKYFNQLPLSIFPADNTVPFVTRSTCTGNTVQAHELAERTGGAVENMEGAAIVHVALAHGLPVGEIRGISNMAGDRDRSTWRIRQAADAAADALFKWLAQHPC